MTTLNTLLTELRADLDERSPGIWSDTDLARWLNHGIHKTIIGIKSVREDYFVKRMRSSDADLTIFGSTYDPSNIAMVNGTTVYTLPDDLLEIRSFEPLNQTDRDDGILFLPKDFSESAFSSARRTAGTDSRKWYYYDQYGTNQLLIAPAPQAAIATEMFYVSITQEYALGDTISTLPPWAFNAVKEYAYYRALKSQNHPDTNNALARFKDELSDTRSLATPRNSQEPRFVEGVFDSEDFDVAPEYIPGS